MRWNSSPVRAALAALAVALPAGRADAQTWYGLSHAPEGSAVLGTDPQGRLLVDNLGSNGDLVVDVSDLVQLILSWGACPGAA